jgi:CheY-like chemotaxis protein
MLRCYPQSALRSIPIELELTSRSSRPSPPSRILIVEDDLLVGLIIEEMCREAGCRVARVAHTVSMARAKLAKGDFDAVLLDLSMGDAHNLQIADCLLAKGTPFAFVTGYDYLVEPRHEKVPLLLKPFTPMQLMELLATLARQTKQQIDWVA